MIHEIVIARYNENIERSKKLDPKYKLIVYNKGEAMDGTIPLENIGRESHTWIYHILKNRDNLADFTTFLQGHPFDHDPRILENISEHQLRFYAKYLKTEEPNGVPYHCGLPTGKRVEQYFDHKPEYISFYGSGQFTVSKERIRYRHKEFYMSLMKHLEDDPIGINSFAYGLERMRQYIFDGRTVHKLGVSFQCKTKF